MLSICILFGKRVVPTYKFQKCRCYCKSFGADFLQDWIGELASVVQIMLCGRNPEFLERMSKHYQFESNLSLTGSNADYRFPIKPSEQGALLVNLYNLIATAKPVKQH